MLSGYYITYEVLSYNPRIIQVVAADPDLLWAKSLSGHTSLHLATIAGNRVVAKYLLTRGAEVNAVDDEKHTPAHWATGGWELL